MLLEPKIGPSPHECALNLALASVPATVIWDLTYITYFIYINIYRLIGQAVTAAY